MRPNYNAFITLEQSEMTGSLPLASTYGTPSGGRRWVGGFNLSPRLPAEAVWRGRRPVYAVYECLTDLLILPNILHMREPIEVEFKGKKVRAVGSKVFIVNPNTTDHEIYIKVLHKTFGSAWYGAEFKKLLEERHAVAKWWVSFCEFQKINSTASNRTEKGWSAIPTGDALSLLSLAYDLYCLDHTSNLSKEIIDRLRDKEAFQGVRYEVAVAAIFSRLDYKLEFLSDKSKKHCEFIAENPATKEVLGVEAKSRRRPGILHQPGQAQNLEEIKSGVVRMVNQAIEQRPPDIPFVIFVDLNLPSTGLPTQESKWFQDIKKGIDNEGQNSAENLSKYTMLVVTNYAYHYEGTSTLEEKKYGEYLAVIPKYAQCPFTRLSTIGEILQEVSCYNHIPDKQDPKQLEQRRQQVSDKIKWIKEASFFLKKEPKKMKCPAAITTLLTCQHIEMDQTLLTLHNIGHTLFSKTGAGTIDIWIYVEGHWFSPGKHSLSIKIVDEEDKVVSAPPPFEVTVSENGIFETKLLLEKHILFKVGTYYISAVADNGPSAMTELEMLT